jgi:hypothetical protein
MIFPSTGGGKISDSWNNAEEGRGRRYFMGSAGVFWVAKLRGYNGPP